jgi:hypothetical protein
MQKISSYLYPNRIELLADLSGFTVEFTNVYQRNIKIYNGIDNTIEFDIKNADQKRIDLTTLSQIYLNVMDVSGNALPNSPYIITPLLIKGIGATTIPQEDLLNLSPQYLAFSVSAMKNGNAVMLYADTKFGAVGTMELVGNAMPTTRPDKIYKSFTAEIDLNGNPIFHSSAIPVKFYEAVPTSTISLNIHVTGFVGSIWVDATTNSTINAEAFRAAGKPFGSWTQRAEDGMFTGVIPYASNLPVGDYDYFRVSYQATSLTGYGANFDVLRANGVYTQVTIRNSGTAYMADSLLKIPGSQLGGLDGVNDLIITIRSVEGTGSSYSMGSIASINYSGAAAIGTGKHVVSGVNYSGLLDSVTVI